MKTTFFQRILLILLGVFLALIVLEIVLRLAGFICVYWQDHRDPNLSGFFKKYRIMCIGESTTAWGKNGGTTEGSYPSQLQEILNTKSKYPEFLVFNEGLVGKSTSDILFNLEDMIERDRPNMIIAMMGINDATGYAPFITTAKKNGSFLHCFRTYYFFRALWDHLVNKVWELNLFKKKQGPAAMPVRPGIEPSGLMQRRISLSTDQVRKFQRYRYRCMKGDISKTGYLDVENSCQNAINIEPKDPFLYTRLIELYSKEKNIPALNNVFLQAIQNRLTENQGLFDEWEKIFRDIGNFFFSEKDYSRAEQAFWFDIDIAPRGLYFSRLIDIYNERGDSVRARQIFDQGTLMVGPNHFLFASLGTVYQREGNIAFANLCFNKAKILESLDLNPVTMANLRRMRDIARKKNIQLICVQYPMRSLASLKESLGDTAGIIFVDNEEVFREAVKKRGYSAIFFDSFGLDFGHATEEGNRILAENIAGVLVKSGVLSQEMQ